MTESLIVFWLTLVFQYRYETVVPQRMVDMERAIKERDFKSFARLTMQARGQNTHYPSTFHSTPWAVCTGQ